jgi:hypothetical protein
MAALLVLGAMVAGLSATLFCLVILRTSFAMALLAYVAGGMLVALLAIFWAWARTCGAEPRPWRNIAPGQAEADDSLVFGQSDTSVADQINVNRPAPYADKTPSTMTPRKPPVRETWPVSAAIGTLVLLLAAVLIVGRL